MCSFRSFRQSQEGLVLGVSDIRYTRTNAAERGSRISRVITTTFAVLAIATRSRRWTALLAVSLVLLLVLGGFALGHHLAAGATGTVDLQSTRESPAIRVTSPAVVRSAARTVGLINSGCGDPVFGSGIAVARGYVVTSAHVVAGTSDHLVVPPNGRTTKGTVVLFDPGLDVAVLRTPGLDLGGIPQGKASAGMSTAVVGFSAGRRRHISGATVRSLIAVTDRDIYGAHEIHRQVMVMAARVRGGDSGGPVLSAEGRYVGMVYGFSIADPNVGYALTAEAIRSDIDHGLGRKMAVATGRCLNGLSSVAGCQSSVISFRLSVFGFRSAVNR